MKGKLMENSSAFISLRMTANNIVNLMVTFVVYHSAKKPLSTS